MQRLNGRDAQQLVSAMDAFRSGQRPATVMDRIAKGFSDDGGIVSVFYHPCEFVHQEFWDGVNFRGGANPPIASAPKWNLNSATQLTDGSLPDPASKVPHASPECRQIPRPRAGLWQCERQAARVVEAGQRPYAPARGR